MIAIAHWLEWTLPIFSLVSQLDLIVSLVGRVDGAANRISYGVSSQNQSKELGLNSLPNLVTHSRTGIIDSEWREHSTISCQLQDAVAKRSGRTPYHVQCEPYWEPKSRRWREKNLSRLVRCHILYWVVKRFFSFRNPKWIFQAVNALEWNVRLSKWWLVCQRVDFI